MQGLTYTQQYLKRMLAENLILHQFEKSSVIAILQAVAPDYQDFYLNLCEQSLTNAIGLALIGQNGRTLRLGAKEQEAIMKRMQNRSTEEQQQILRSAALSICNEMNISEEWIREYINAFVETLYPRIGVAIKYNNVSHIFIGTNE